MKINKKAFTLVELLVVVLIIGILAAIAVPQYQEAVEKSIMQEAILNLRNIAQAQDVFFLQNGRYATHLEMDKLDISIPGKRTTQASTGLTENRIMTKYFIYVSNYSSGRAKAVAHRVKEGVIDYQNNAPYYMAISQSTNKLGCTYSKGNNIQKKLCDQIQQKGYL